MPARTWTHSDIRFLRENYKKLSYVDIAAAIGKTPAMVKSQASNLKITTTRKWSDSQLSILRDLYPDTRTDVIAKMIGKPLHSVYGMAKKLELKKSASFLRSEDSGRLTKLNNTRGTQTRFRKGRSSWNKGKKIGSHPNAIATQFKAGQTPHNHVPVGTEVVATIGYLTVKVAEPNVWEFCHHKLWREHHGEVPAGHMIYFKDGDRMNVTIGNLAVESRQEWMKRYTLHNYPEPVKAAIHALAGFKRKLRGYAKKQDRRSAESSV